MTAKPTPRAIAVTGGIASGKSTVAAAFQALGIAVLSADAVARELVAPGQPALHAIVEHFGAALLAADGRLDRAALRRHVFADPPARAALEAILHPRIRDALRERAEAADGAYIVVEIPLLAETGAYPWLARVLVVDVPEALQIARVMRRDGVDAAAARQTLAAQASRTARLACADDVIINDAGLEQLQDAVGKLDRRYRSGDG